MAPAFIRSCKPGFQLKTFWIYAQFLMHMLRKYKIEHVWVYILYMYVYLAYVYFLLSFQTATQGDGAFFQANLGLKDK